MLAAAAPPITSQTASTATTPAYLASPQAAKYCRFVYDSLQGRRPPLRRSPGRPASRSPPLYRRHALCCLAWRAIIISTGPFNLSCTLVSFLVYCFPFLYRQQYLTKYEYMLQASVRSATTASQPAVPPSPLRRSPARPPGRLHVVVLRLAPARYVLIGMMVCAIIASRRICASCTLVSFLAGHGALLK